MQRIRRNIQLLVVVAAVAALAAIGGVSSQSPAGEEQPLRHILPAPSAPAPADSQVIDPTFSGLAFAHARNAVPVFSLDRFVPAANSWQSKATCTAQLANAGLARIAGPVVAPAQQLAPGTPVWVTRTTSSDLVYVRAYVRNSANSTGFDDHSATHEGLYVACRTAFVIEREARGAAPILEVGYSGFASPRRTAKSAPVAGPSLVEPRVFWTSEWRPAAEPDSITLSPRDTYWVMPATNPAYVRAWRVRGYDAASTAPPRQQLATLRIDARQGEVVARRAQFAMPAGASFYQPAPAIACMPDTVLEAGSLHCSAAPAITLGYAGLATGRVPDTPVPTYYPWGPLPHSPFALPEHWPSPDRLAILHGVVQVRPSSNFLPMSEVRRVPTTPALCAPGAQGCTMDPGRPWRTDEVELVPNWMLTPVSPDAWATTTPDPRTTDSMAHLVLFDDELWDQSDLPPGVNPPVQPGAGRRGPGGRIRRY